MVWSGTGWDGRSQVDSTLSRSSSGRGFVKSEVSIFSPAGSPGVSDKPVLLGSVSSVSDSGDTVVQLSSAVSSVNTRLVGHDVFGVDGDRDDSLGDVVLQLLHAVLWNISVSADGGNEVAGGSLARLVDSGVWVGSLSLDTSVVSSGLGSLDVLESVVHPSSVATVVAVGGGAVDQLLLGERSQSVSGDGVGGLGGGDGGESPAGSAHSLVLDWVDGDEVSWVLRGVSPVNGVWVGSDVVDVLDVSLGSSGSETGVLDSEFWHGEVHESVWADGVWLSNGFGLLQQELGVVDGEDGHSVVSLGWSVVQSSVLLTPLVKSLGDDVGNSLDRGFDLSLVDTSGKEGCDSDDCELSSHFNL